MYHSHHPRFCSSLPACCGDFLNRSFLRQWDWLLSSREEEETATCWFSWCCHGMNEEEWDDDVMVNNIVRKTEVEMKSIILVEITCWSWQRFWSESYNSMTNVLILSISLLWHVTITNLFPKSTITLVIYWPFSTSFWPSQICYWCCAIMIARAELLRHQVLNCNWKSNCLDRLNCAFVAA